MTKRRLMVSVAELLLGIAPIVAQTRATPAPVPMSTFQDTETGVRFRYPLVWKQVSPTDEYASSAIWSSGETPKIMVAFSPKGNVYAKTSLELLSFIFLVPVVHSEPECLNRVLKNDALKSFDKKTIHDVVYQHGSGGGAGMCHGQNYDVYATYRGGRCFVFEKDFNTHCTSSDDGTRELTSTEEKALQNHLDGIMQSVTFP